MEDAAKVQGSRSPSPSRGAPPPAADTRAFDRQLGAQAPAVAEGATSGAQRSPRGGEGPSVFSEAAGLQAGQTGSSTSSLSSWSTPRAFSGPPLASFRTEGTPIADPRSVDARAGAINREAGAALDAIEGQLGGSRSNLVNDAPAFLAALRERVGTTSEITSDDHQIIPTTLWNPDSASESGSDHVAVGLSEFLRAPTGSSDSGGPTNPLFDGTRHGAREIGTQAGPGHVAVDFRKSTAADGDVLIPIRTDDRTYRPTEGFALDVESGRPVPPAADKLSMFAVRDNIARAHLADMVRTHEMSDALIGLFDRPEELALPAQIAKLETSLNALIANAPGLSGSSVAGDSSGGDTILQGDSPRVAGRNSDGEIEIREQPRVNVNVTKLQTLQQTLATQMQTLQEHIQGKGEGTGLRQLKDNMLLTGAREKVHEHTRPLAGTFASGERNTLGDGVKRNIMGKEAHAVLIRSVLQAAITTGGTYGVQMATSEWLKSHFEENPDQIPNPLLDAARKALGGEATLNQVRDKAIEELSKPGSTYIDETKATRKMIIALEAGLGFGRGTIIPVADSINETDAKKAKVKSAIDNAEEPKVTKTPGEKANAAMANAFKPQLVANMLSGAVAAVAQAGSSIRNNENAGAALLEMGKTMTFAGVTTASNIAADGIRARHDGGQFEKAFLRTVFRTIAQATKTGISIGESALRGTMDARAPASDWIRAGMQGVLGSIVKEGAGSAAQATVDALLPTNEVAMLKVGKTISAAADVLRTLNEIEETGKPLLDESAVEGARAEIKLALERIYDVNTADFGSDKFNYAFQDYASNVNRVIVEDLRGAELPDPTERNVAGTSSPTSRDAARTQA
jgi:hypothetical protein